MTIRVMLVDDHAIVREGYKRLLELVADVARVHSRQLVGEEVSIVATLGRPVPLPVVIDIRPVTEPPPAIDLDADADARIDAGVDPDPDPGPELSRR